MVDRSEFERWHEAAQLALKGLLHGVGSGAWGHDLTALGAAAEGATAEPMSAGLRAGIRRLTRHYIPARYPDAHPSGAPQAHYVAEDAEEALLDARDILDWTSDIWRRIESSG